MTLQDNQTRVRRACRLLLGAEERPAGILHIDRAMLKRLYRRQALASHPDRSGGDGGHFVAVTDAYELLDGLLADSPEAALAVGIGAEPNPPAPPSREGVPTEFRMPAATLRFGQYLFYRGIISREELVNALVWQGRQRPNFGSIAKQLGYLDEAGIASLLAYRGSDEALGEAAVRLGMLTAYQRLVVLGYQRRFQAEIGRYFVESGILDESGFAEEFRRFRSHNLRCRATGQPA